MEGEKSGGVDYTTPCTTDLNRFAPNLRQNVPRAKEIFPPRFLKSGLQLDRKAMFQMSLRSLDICL